MTNNSPATTTPPGKTPPRWLLKILSRTHVMIHRASGGRIGNTMKGDEVCFVTMTGAKSGNSLVKPLMYVPWGDGLLLVASLGGAPKNPVWYNNLVKHPDIVVRQRTRKLQLTARLATADEKVAMWPACDAQYAPFAQYRAKTTRDIPIFVCEPRP